MGPMAVLLAQDFSAVPGSIVSYQAAPSLEDLASGRDVYLSSPSLAALPDGTYVATHDLFGSGSGADVSATTRVFRSVDRGATWSFATELSDIGRASLFVCQGHLFLLGYRKEGGDILIRRSNDGGSTWTRPQDENDGVLRWGAFSGAPSMAVEHAGKIWVGQGTTGILSAPLNADLLKAATWTLSNKIGSSREWFDGRFQLWGEAQVAASPTDGVVAFPRIQQVPYTALVRADAETGMVSFDPGHDFVSFPGGEKKFGVGYDPILGRYYALTNPVLPADAHRDVPLQMRNAAALMSSRDLRHWDVEYLFLYGKQLETTGWQYFNFIVDGPDCAVISRTAFPVDGRNPPRGHDSNLLTFHRLHNFRTQRPRFRLYIDRVANSILRLEQTGYESAPHGSFVLGEERIGGASGAKIEGMALQGDQVLIKDESGYVACFDLAGNYLGVVCAPVPADLLAEDLAIPAPPREDRIWRNMEGGKWSDPLNWFYWGRPDTADERAVFGTTASGPCAIDLDLAISLRGMRLFGAGNYQIGGQGSITLGGERGGHGELVVESGTHSLAANVHLETPLDVWVASGAVLELRGVWQTSGHPVKVSGGGILRLSDSLNLADSVVTLEADTTLEITEETTVQGRGVLRIEFPAAFVWHEGMTLLMRAGWETAFSEIVWPEVPWSWQWDLSKVISSGQAVVRRREDRSAQALLKYALGENSVSAGVEWPVIRSIDGRLKFEFLRQRNDVRYIVQASPDLVTWVDVATNPGTVGARVEFMWPMQTAAQFLRLRLEAEVAP